MRCGDAGLLTIGLYCAVCAGPARAQELGPALKRGLDWHRNEFVFLHGGEFKLGSPMRSNFGWNHFSGWRHGDSFAFFNLIRRKDIGAEYYGEGYSYLSLKKTTGFQPPLPLVGDVLPGIGLNIGGEPIQSGFNAVLLGGKVVFDIPWVQNFHVQAWAFQSNIGRAWGTQITPAWYVPIRLGRHRVVFRGFFDFRSAAATGGEAEIFGEPELHWDLGHYFGQNEKVLLGMRLDVAANKFGVKGVDETAWQLMFVYAF